MNVALLLFMLFFGSASFPPVGEFLSSLARFSHERGDGRVGFCVGWLRAIQVAFIGVTIAAEDPAPEVSQCILFREAGLDLLLQASGHSRR
jgi:hypothetical protein